MRTIDERLAEIAAAIASGTPASTFQAELDQLLGTSMEERDEETEAAWEQGYRNKVD